MKYELTENGKCIYIYLFCELLYFLSLLSLNGSYKIL